MSFDSVLGGLQIAGVAKKSAGPTWRRVTWIVIAVVAFLYGNLIGVLLIGAPLIALIVLLAIIAAVIGMLLTSTNKKGTGSEFFTFVQGGFSRWPIGGGFETREYQELDGQDPRVIIKRVSRVWASMSVVQFDDRGKRQVLLAGGIRCQDVDREVVEGLLMKLVNGESIAEEHEHIQRLNNLHNPEFSTL
ncbi:MAG: hypothetical protein AB8C13_09295 [Phycisphaerales bacterium]